MNTAAKDDDDDFQSVLIFFLLCDFSCRPGGDVFLFLCNFMFFYLLDLSLPGELLFELWIKLRALEVKINILRDTPIFLSSRT